MLTLEENDYLTNLAREADPDYVRDMIGTAQRIADNAVELGAVSLSSLDSYAEDLAGKSNRLLALTTKKLIGNRLYDAIPTADQPQPTVTIPTPNPDKRENTMSDQNMTPDTTNAVMGVLSAMNPAVAAEFQHAAASLTESVEKVLSMNLSANPDTYANTAAVLMQSTAQGMFGNATPAEKQLVLAMVRQHAESRAATRHLNPVGLGGNHGYRKMGI